MRRAHSSDPDVLVYEKRSGWLLLTAILLVPLTAGGVALWYFDLWSCLPCLGFLFVVVCVRQWLTTSTAPVHEVGGRELPTDRPSRLELDRSRRTITARASGRSRTQRTYPFDAFDGLQLSCQTTTQGRSWSTEYLIHLVGGEDALLVGWGGNYHAARLLAGEIGSFLSLPVTDASQDGGPVVLRSEDIGRSIRDQPPGVTASGTALVVGGPPSGRPLDVNDLDLGGPPSGLPHYVHEWRREQFVFRELPRMTTDWGSRAFYVGGLVLLLILGGGLVGWLFAHPKPQDPGTPYCCLVFFVVLALLWSWLFVSALDFGLATLTADPTGLTLVRQYRRSARTQTYPVEKIQELRLKYGHQLNVITDKETAFLVSVKKEDAAWLVACVERALRG
jgi:hypothetical protein